MLEDDSTFVEEGQYALEEATAQLQEALDLTVIQFQCFLQEAPIYKPCKWSECYSNEGETVYGFEAEVFYHDGLLCYCVAVRNHYGTVGRLLPHTSARGSQHRVAH